MADPSVKEKWSHSVFYRLREGNNSRIAVVLIHGLGDNGDAFSEIFSVPWSQQFTLVVPDLPGFGQSRANHSKADYTVSNYLSVLEQIVTELCLKRVHVVGHSLGADIATMWAKKSSRIKSVINVEGTLVNHDLAACRAAKAAELDGSFDSWFRDVFCEMFRRQTNPAYVRYCRSLNACDANAFLAMALQVCDFTSNEGYVSLFGSAFQSLKIPKLVFLAEKRKSPLLESYLSRNSINSIWFDNASHWLMSDCPGRFYAAARDFLLSIEPCERPEYGMG